MSHTVRAPYARLGPGGDYAVEMNFAVRVWDQEGEAIPPEGRTGACLKGGQRTNYFGAVPLLDGRKNLVGRAEVLRIISARPEDMPAEELVRCGFQSREAALDFVRRVHREEFERDGVFTVYHFRVLERAGRGSERYGKS
jgi:hypothetical protein